MTAIARRLFTARRELGRRWPLAVVLGVLPLLALGTLSGPELLRGELPQLSIVALLTVTLLTVIAREAGPEAEAPGSQALHELEVGLLLLTAIYVLLAGTGGLTSFLYPLVFAAVSFLLLVLRHRAVAWTLVASIAGFELLLGWNARMPERTTLIAHHLTFALFFACGQRLVIAGLVQRLRGEHARRIEEERERMRQEAREFRLIAAALPPESRARSRVEEEARMAHAAVESIHEQLFHTLDLLRTALRLHTCALLWCEADGANKTGSRAQVTLKVKEIATASELVVESRTLTGPGVLTTVIAEPKTLLLRALAGKRVPPYYAGPEAITDLCAVPLVEGASLRGILCADRTSDTPFEGDEVRVLTNAALHIQRVIAHERTFTAVERSKYEQEQFYRASELLGGALTLEQVYERTFAAIRAIASYDLAVVCGTTESARQGVLAVDHGGELGAWSQLAHKLEERELAEPTSLVAMAVKNRHPMPANGLLSDPDTLVFDAETRARAAKSVFVLPLLRGDEVLGTVTLLAARPGQYPAETREMLRVIGHQVSVSLQNGRMYRAMEMRATTDGLTGLTNHRAFQERLGQLHDLCERTGQKYSIILTDIDHFKSINDTYGHPVGDQVLKRVAALFSGRARKVDIVARYGGEEFVLVLPDTDGQGAEHFANRLREDVAAQVMTSEHGSFKITISMGVAEFPGDGGERMALIEKADQALYTCKENGRNCVRRWSA